jgi:hypothetical protein
MFSSQYYFNKYRKYKNKYLLLKGGNPISNIDLYLKFITEKLIALDTDIIRDDEPIDVILKEEEESKKKLKDSKKRKTKMLDAEDIEDLKDEPRFKTSRFPTRIKKRPDTFNDYIENLTPEILKYLSPLSKSRMIDDLEIDDKKIEEIKKMQEIKDPEYLIYENYGKLIECWIADNITCPCCGLNSLRRYSNDSMPVIDIVCINPNHTINLGVKFFQIKTSNGTFFLDKPYFMYDETDTDINANTIHVGSRRWGDEVHKIKPQDTLFIKKILCGYICINYTDNETTLRINTTNSFIVLPEYLLFESMVKRILSFEITEILESSENNWYYHYIEPNKSHERIKFNIKTNKIITNDDLKKIIHTQIIPKSYVEKTISMTNPLSIFDK